MESLPAWQLQPASSTTRLWLFLLAVMLPVAITIGALALAANDPGPKQLIGNNTWPTHVVVVIGLLALCLAIHWIIGRALRRHRITLDGGGLTIATTFYTRKLGWEGLQLQQARVVDLDEHTGLKPLFKSNGTSLPGFRSGWFRLRNRRKALVATAGGLRVLHLPTTQGYDLLLQPRQPQALLQRLRELAPAGARR
jgi:hypothetical protein